MTDFVKQHKKEIEECAYQIYLMRQRYCQPDNSISNFLRAIEIVKERYKIAGLNRWNGQDI